MSNILHARRQNNNLPGSTAPAVEDLPKRSVDDDNKMIKKWSKDKIMMILTLLPTHGPRAMTFGSGATAGEPCLDHLAKESA